MSSRQIKRQLINQAENHDESSSEESKKPFFENKFKKLGFNDIEDDNQTNLEICEKFIIKEGKNKKKKKKRKSQTREKEIFATEQSLLGGEVHQEQIKEQSFFIDINPEKFDYLNEEYRIFGMVPAVKRRTKLKQSIIIERPYQTQKLFKGITMKIVKNNGLCFGEYVYDSKYMALNDTFYKLCYELNEEHLMVIF